MTASCHAGPAGPDPRDLDLAAYLARLGLARPTAPTLAAASAVLAAHMRAIPFENLDVLLGRLPRLDLASLQAKLVDGRRGGYCFEHAALLGAALRRLGFEVRDALARVVIERPREAMGRTHHLLVLRLPEGEFVLDPGFGGLAPRVPVPLREGATARIGRERHGFRRDGAVWTLVAEGGEAPLDLWSTPFDEAFAHDFEMGNHFTATHPASRFRERLSLRALTDDGRVSVLNREVTWRQGAELRRWTLADRAELHALLRTHFGIDLPEVLQLRVPAIPAWT